MKAIDLNKERMVFESKHINEFNNVLFEQTDDGVGQYVGKTSHYEDYTDAEKLTYGWWSWVECANQKQSEVDECVMIAESLDESYVRECKKNKALQEQIKELESQVEGLIIFHQIRDISDEADELRKDARLTDHKIDLEFN